MITFGQAYRATFSGSFAFLAACPVLALVPVAFELIQHLAEFHIGMYDSLAAAKALEHAPLRMALGMVKVAALIVPTYWVVRFLATRDPWFAVRFEGRAVRLFAVVVAVQLALSALQLFVLPQTLSFVLSGFAAGEVIGALLVAWGVAAALGDGAVGPIVSIRIMAPQLLWTIALGLATTMPLMIPHYVLGALAIVGPKPLLWPILVADALLVGWLTVVMIGSGYYAAVRAADRVGIRLSPAAPATANGQVSTAP